MSLVSVPRQPGDFRQQLIALAQGLNNALAGKLSCIGDVTLAAAATTTTLTDSRLSADSVILFMPTTATAAAALSGLYVSARTNGAATLTHANTADADKSFAYAIIG